ncbi:Histone-lysine N-methyltransferase setd3 [Nowakowskiella sp. JEL0078]|nr:Histone-lysine N-methyltransferase setd3 [Nowakowskiella sp. JEL0078]
MGIELDFMDFCARNENTRNMPQPTLKEWQDLLFLVSVAENLTSQTSPSPSPQFLLTPLNADDALDNLSSWLLKIGANFPKLCLKTSPGRGSGLFALEPIDEGEFIAIVPVTCIMTVANVASKQLKNFVKNDRILQEIPSLSLALTLLIEALNPKSLWQPYIQALPRSFSIPLFYSAKDFAELKGSPILGIKFYIHKNPLSGLNLDQFTYSAFRWAVAVIMTRQNPIPVISGDHVDRHFALIPLYDMFNHRGGGEITTNYNLENNTSETTSPANFKTGEEVLITYGKRANKDLFLYSGFVDLDICEYDRFGIWLGLGISDKLYVQKANLLSRIHLPSSGNFELGYPPVVSTSKSLLIFCRIFTMQKEELDMISALQNPLLKLQDFSLSDEVKRTFEWLRNRCILLLQGNRTPDVINNEDLNINQIQSRKLRIAEKRMLEATIRDLAKV